MLKQYGLTLPHEVFCGHGALGRIADILAGSGTRRLAVFTDKGVENAGVLQKVLSQFPAGMAYTVLDELPAEPNYSQVQALVDQCGGFGADMILACGGGSVMDTAKLASVLAGERYGVRELLDSPGMARKRVRSVAVPSTVGTGAEATPNAIVGVPERELKIGIVNAEMVFDYVILDPAVVRELPRRIVASSGVDAMAHAIECFTGNKANPLSDTFALDAFGKILDNIERAYDDPSAEDAIQAMQLAAFYAGIAITGSGTTAVHALSYPLGGKYHIAHGVSNAMLLMPVMRFNEPAIRERLAAAYDHAVRERGSCRTAGEKSAWLIGRMGDIVEHLHIPTSLTAFGVPREDLEDLVRSGMEVRRLLDNNMRPVTAKDAREIYRQLL